MGKRGDAQPPRLWDDAAFLRRVSDIAVSRNRSLREISIAAGMAHDYLSRPAPRSGRSIEPLLRVAAELDVPVCELLGIKHEQFRQPLSLDTETLSRLGFAADVAAHLYVSMSDRGEMPNEAAAMEIVETIVKMIKRQPPLQSGNNSPEQGK